MSTKFFTNENENTLLSKIEGIREEKLVVFSESKETAAYLYDELQKSGFNKILAADSKNRKDKFPFVKANLDANIPLTFL